MAKLEERSFSSIFCLFRERGTVKPCDSKLENSKLFTVSKLFAAYQISISLQKSHDR